MKPAAIATRPKVAPIVICWAPPVRALLEAGAGLELVGEPDEGLLDGDATAEATAEGVAPDPAAGATGVGVAADPAAAAGTEAAGPTGAALET